MAPNFWSDPKVEPKRSYRYVFTLGKTIENTIESFFVRAVKKPSFTISEVEHQYVGNRFYFPGRVTWNTMDVTFVDPVTPDASAVLTNIFKDGGYKVPRTQEQAEFSMTKAGFSDNIGNPIITIMDANRQTIEEWKMWNAWITSVDFGQLDYTSDELVLLTMTLRYDYATMDNPGQSPSSGLVPEGGA
jgi:hypothetical protein